MLFSEPTFLFLFLPGLLAVHFIAPHAARNTILLAASLLFYAWGEKEFTVLMLVSIGINYAIGRWLAASADPVRRRRIVAAGVSANLILLATFKYGNFIVDNFNWVATRGAGRVINVRPIHLPVGISFFTFQAMSYVIDVYRRTTLPQHRFSRLALYISLFPQLIAGPIVRYHDIASQLADRWITVGRMAYGIERFVLGLAKKMIIANSMGYVADQLFALPPAELSATAAWLAAVTYGLQIYFDFSGYSDMAIGLGAMFGFRFPENFNFPYVATSITEFWRRWHISLSTWFRDYLYIPLGGNRHGKWRTCFNLVTVFALCGLWHGAAWNFIVWGLFHGAFLIIERVGFLQGASQAPALLKHAYTLLVVLIGWVLFRAESLSAAGEILAAMCGLGTRSGSVDAAPFLSPEVLVCLPLGILFALPVFPAVRDRLQTLTRDKASARLSLQGVRVAILLLLLFYCELLVAAGSYNPFIYFRF